MLSSNYWLKPIYQELLHAASGHNSSPEGERKRPCSGLTKVIAHQRQYPGRGRDDHTARFSDWIGGHCPADTLMVWFPAHWMPQVLRDLEARGDAFRLQHPQWFDGEVPRHLREEQRKALNSRRLQFQCRPYKTYPVSLLTVSLRFDWLTHMVTQKAEGYVRQLPNLRNGVVCSIYQTKAATPWGGNKSEGIQISTCLPNDRDLDTWFDAVYALPLNWPDITDIGSKYQKQVCAEDLRKLCDDLGMDHMWEQVDPQWKLLKQNLYNTGPHLLSPQELEDRLLVNRSCPPGMEVKDRVCPNTNYARWNDWYQAIRDAEAICQHRPPLHFRLRQPILDLVLQTCCRDSQQLQLQFRPIHDQVRVKEERDSKRRRKKSPKAKLHD